MATTFAGTPSDLGPSSPSEAEGRPLILRHWRDPRPARVPLIGGAKLLSLRGNRDWTTPSSNDGSRVSDNGGPYGRSLLRAALVPKNYSLPSDPVYLPADLDEDVYNHIIEQRPDLEDILSRQRRRLLRLKEMPYSQSSQDKTTDDDPEVLLVENDDDDITKPLSDFKDGRTTQSARVPPFLEEKHTGSVGSLRAVKSNESRMLPFLGSRRWWIFGGGGSAWDEAWKMSNCYYCSIDEDIPRSPVCHRMFNSNEWKYRTVARYYRTVCYYNWNHRNSGYVKYKWYRWQGSYTYPESRGLTLHRMGGYTLGCFKRYIDISDVFSTRGCRAYWPSVEGGLVKHRMARLQVPLVDAINTTCITSPHASLTPFHRGISLWARYHVCVCKGRYCNKAILSDVYKPLLIIGLYICAFLNKYLPMM
ncbi:hypothetical protein HW555_013278 [Spodoptera exigua]|uniref:Uncharacterized protein n=1 Tax=Spodoptera exigua TaxID=7107 RepID=A0A835G1Z9_SPOEX|nr:hypothetical protein HW555_013278 [Spodoptera exigua]